MRINTEFDPVFDGQDRRTGDQPRAEHAPHARHRAFVFDGWSYQPMAEPRATEAAAPAKPVH